MSLPRSEQSRVNGAKSRRLKTAEGEARLSLNALKHRCYAIGAVLLSNEDTDVFENLVLQSVLCIRPADRIEYDYARELAAIEGRLNRVNALEASVFDREMDTRAPTLAQTGKPVSEPNRLSKAGRRVVDSGRSTNYPYRQEAQFRRVGINAARPEQELRDFRSSHLSYSLHVSYRVNSFGANLKRTQASPGRSPSRARSYWGRPVLSCSAVRCGEWTALRPPLISPQTARIPRGRDMPAIA
jgi:hypothetical protein